MTSNDREPIAIVGTGCRFPGNSSSPSKLWELLKEPRDVQTEIPKERFNPAGFYHPNGMHHASTNVRRSYLLSEDHRLFDAQFFNIHPMEANAMDPQQRILLETVYEATESAGLPLEKLRGSDTAVFIGLMNEEYSTHLLRDPDSTPMYIGTGTARSLVSNRISYFFDWHGPSMTIDTACSSSLVSMHQAVQSLRSLESRVAVVGGTNLIISPEPFISESKLKMLSPGGRSRMWDINADGYARGDGVAAIVLKRLSDALRDGDSIECIIRETGVNQDGKTKGITMPSPISQMELIRSTYERAGLNPFKDRPQYFEAHGTGTPAGDPVEAEAIHRSFFDSDSNSGTRAEIPLYVGSVKTVIGHTEGTAGLAGIIKASLALKHGTIPPNMLLRTLSPAVEPFYGSLKIVSKSTAWPPITIGQSRRASVNSFGFGGTNAHAILESYQDSIAGPHPQQLQLPIPFVFSAASEKALSAMLVNHADYLKTKPDVDLHDLAYTLRERRSTLPVRAAISASTTTELVEKMSVLPTQSGGSASNVVRDGASAPHILGIFTGQGAQWAGMGRELLLQSKFVESIITSLDSILKTLPPPFRPSWSLKDELLADSSASRLSEAAISQPICTAIQIVLVDILRSSGVKLQAVVGHSSGEIGAAYASGFISAADAIKIAYYRGFHAHRASSPNGNQVRGAMMAVGTSVIDATELCEHPDMEGRICVAACNSSSSVTISGDADAVEEAKEIFDDEIKFARLLKVDTAYHSPHMLACSDHYFQSLKESSIGIKTPGNDTTWISSVEAGKAMSASSDLTEVYWVENMIKPVLFMQAVKSALAHSGPFNMAIEIGPHPALKGPALQSIQESTGIEIPYLSLLSRAKNAAHTTSDALGSLWCHFGGKGLDLSRSRTTLTGYETVPRLLKDLPTYAWDHDKAFWFESRISKTYRTHSREIHHLLGTESLDNTEDRICWKNLLRLSEMPWLQGHQLQHQVIFPAAGYVVTAFEAAVVLAKHHPIQLLEVEDLTIEKSIAFDESDSGVEVAIALTNIVRGAKHITAHFSYHAGLGKDPEKLTLISNCRVKIVLGEHASLALPEKSGTPPNLANIDSEIFYTSLEKLGYQYTGAFKALTQLRRKLNIGTCEIVNEPLSDWSKQLLIHPAMLDATFQSLFLASSHPGDGTLQELHVPIGIQRIRINPHFRDALSIEQSFSLDCRLRPKISSHITGDVDIFTPGGGQGVVQVEGITVVPLASSTPAQDRPLFSQFIWGSASPDGVVVSQSHRSTPEEFEFQLVAEQVALYYLNKVIGEITEAEWAAADWHFAHMRNFARVSIAAVQSGEQPFTERHWMENTREQVFVMMEKYPGRVELQIMKAVGDNLPAAIRGETNILEHMIDGNALTRFYEEETGIECLTLSLARTAKQLTFRYPHMKILEIGAGTGGATKKVMQHIGDAFTSYTFTDISAGFFEKAQEVFKDHATGMDFKILDIEKDIVEQGYTPHSYDMVIASLVLHATQNMERTMKNVRRLLKPGGFVLMLELTAKGPMKMAFVFCGLPGWYAFGPFFAM
jgi:hybrid polyketide synthase/nonribosomal peptide synthetase ACE1